MEERFNLCVERIKEIKSEPQLKEPFGSYFVQVASFLLEIAEIYEKTAGRKETGLLAENIWNEESNQRLYGEVLEKSYVNLR